jgi:hypothetical protein
LAFGLTLVAALAGCQQQKSAPPPVAEVPSGSFMRKWVADVALKSDSVANVYVREDLLIVYTKNHFGYVFNRDSGGFMWVANITSPGTKVRPPLVLKDYVILPTVATLEVFDRSTGRNRRSVPLPFALRSGAVGAGTHVYFGADDQGYGRVVNLDLAGSQYQATSTKWTLATRGGIASTPAVQQGVVYVGDDHGDVYAVNSDSRAPVWPVKQEGREDTVFGAAGAIRADLKADAFGVYAASEDSKLYCLGRTDGKIRWQYFAGQPLVNSPVVTDTSVYIYVDDVGLVALDKTKGDYNRKPLWTIRNAVQFLAEDERYAYLEGNDHAIIAVERSSGQVKFQSKRKDFYTLATSLKGNVIYTSSEDGHLRAVVPVLTPGTMGEVVFAPVTPEEALAYAK